MLSHFILTVFSLSFTVCNGSILTDPVSRNVSLNSMVNFTCQAQFSSAADILNFLIDSQTVTAALTDRGFTELPLVFNASISSIATRTLTVDALQVNNNTNIMCRAVTDVISISNIAVLLIQGLLASVGDLTAVYLNVSSVILTWTAPYTLDNVPITGYIIDTGNQQITVYNTTEYILTSTDADPCNITTVSVSAVNGAGIGNTNNVSFYFISIPQIDITNIHIVPTVTGYYQVMLDISVDISQLCTGERPDNITVDIIYSNTNTVIQTNTSNVTNDQLMVSFQPPVVNLMTFIVNITLTNIAGNSTVYYFPFGFIGPVQNIISSLVDCTTVNISWDRPAVDDIVNIHNYTVLIYINNILSDTVYINGNTTSYQFMDRNLFNSQYTYTIFGNNELGQGNHSNKTLFYQRATSSNGNVTVITSSYSQSNVTFIFNIPIILECNGVSLQPVNVGQQVNVSIQIQCGDSTIFNELYPVNYTNSPSTAVAPLHQYCSLSITTVGSGNPLIFTLNTFDIMSAIPNVMGQSICIQCIFTSIYAEGCTINVTGSMQQYINTIFRQLPTDMSVEGCITDISMGNYTVYVYDIENGVPVTTYPAVVLYNIVITAVDTTTITTPSPTTTPVISPDAAGSSTEAIAGGSAAAGVVLIGGSGTAIFVVVVVVYRKRNAKKKIRLLSVDSQSQDTTEKGPPNEGISDTDNSKVQPYTTTTYTETEDTTAVVITGGVIYQELPFNDQKDRPIAPAPRQDTVLYAEVDLKKTEQYKQQLKQQRHNIVSGVTVLPSTQESDGPPPVPTKQNKKSHNNDTGSSDVPPPVPARSPIEVPPPPIGTATDNVELDTMQGSIPGQVDDTNRYNPGGETAQTNLTATYL